MYISYDDYEISKDPFENGFEVDDLIAPAISILNKKGYRTAFCCSGHPDRCPFVDYIKQIIRKNGFENIVEGTYQSQASRKLREKGTYNFYDSVAFE